MKRFGSTYFFYHSICYFNLDWHHQCSDLLFLGGWKLDSTFDLWLKILRKNDEKMSDPKSIQNHSRKVPRAPGHQNKWYNSHTSSPGASRRILKISTWNPSFWWLLGLIFLIFLMLTHVLPAAGLEATLKWLVEHILPCSLRVIRRQSGPSLKFQKLRHLE